MARPWPSRTDRPHWAAKRPVFAAQQQLSSPISRARDQGRNDRNQAQDPWAQLEKQLDQHKARTAIVNIAVQEPPHVSLWHQKTKRAEHLAGVDLDAAVGLLAPPCPYNEPGLATLLQAFDDIVEDAKVY